MLFIFIQIVCDKRFDCFPDKRTIGLNVVIPEWNPGNGHTISCHVVAESSCCLGNIEGYL